MRASFVYALLRRTPGLFILTILNMLSLSPTKGRQRLQTELRVALIRIFLDEITFGIERTQLIWRKEPPVIGKMGISRVSLPAPEPGVLSALMGVIDKMKDGADMEISPPKLVDVEAEWTGYLSSVDDKAPEPKISEADKYARIMADARSDVVILYFHGGAHFFMDPISHRPSVVRLAKRIGGRALSVRYRLAPQNPFPAGLFDSLVAYLSLLSPPLGALHKPVPANRIIFAGDSAGGNLCLALIQTLLILRQTYPDGITFHGNIVPIGLPIALSLVSPWTDITTSMPSVYTKHQFDYLPLYPPPPLPPYHPPDGAWPATPPRVTLYASATALTHPLVSPLAGLPNDPRSALWADAPPICITAGDECLEDDAVYMARKIWRAGNKHIVLLHVNGSPHCEFLYSLTSKAARIGLDEFVKFIKGVVDDTGTEKNTTNSRVIDIEWSGDAIHTRSWEEWDAEMSNKADFEFEVGSAPMTEEQVQRRLYASVAKRTDVERELKGQWARQQSSRL